MKSIFEISREGRSAYSLPDCDCEVKKAEDLIPEKYLRDSRVDLPQISETDLVKHFTALSKRNFGVDSGFYPLGSCTMKYNPKVNEDIAGMSGFSHMHPCQNEEQSQGCLEVLYSMDKMLSEITGMDRFTLQPAAGAHGELTGLMIIKAYHRHNGDTGRNKIIVPDSSHGTNPASAAMAGFEIAEVKSDPDGNVDIEALRAAAGEDTAGLMLTNPNTLGLFERNVDIIADIIHKAGGLLYYDGANANAIMGITRPGDMGFDIVHLNLHKTFSTPHGGGGPGAGGVGVKKALEAFLPVPLVGLKDDKFFLEYDRPLTIGKVKAFYGNFGVVLKAYAYILSMGADGLKQTSENAVLNANYIMNRLKDYFHLPYDRTCMHEFVLSGEHQKELGVSTLDIAKRLLDFGMHPPTVYFPLIVKEAIMIEPTESWSRETLDEFIEVMIRIAKEAENEPELVKTAPHDTVVGRLDETRAARSPVLVWPVK